MPRTGTDKKTLVNKMFEYLPYTASLTGQGGEEEAGDKESASRLFVSRFLRLCGIKPVPVS